MNFFNAIGNRVAQVVKPLAIAGATAINPVLGVATAATLNAAKKPAPAVAAPAPAVTSVAVGNEPSANVSARARLAEVKDAQTAALAVHASDRVLGMPRTTAIYVGVALAVVLVVGLVLLARRR